MGLQATVTEVLALDDDRLVVFGTLDVDGKTLNETLDDGEEHPIVFRAEGWQSAMTNHFDAKHYDDQGNRTEKAKPRAMTKAEQLGYCKQLLIDSAPSELRAERLNIKG